MTHAFALAPSLHRPCGSAFFQVRATKAPRVVRRERSPRAQILQDCDPYEVSEAAGVAVGYGTLAHVLRGSPEHLSAPLHDIDGDGYVLALTVGEGSTYLRGRYVRTKAYLSEQRAERRLYASRGGTAVESRKFRRLKRACADGMLSWGDRLFAVGDRGLPMWLDPATLVSRGYSALGTVLTDRDEMTRERGASFLNAISVEDGRIAVCSRGVNNDKLFFVEVDNKFGVTNRLEPVLIDPTAIVLDFHASDSKFIVLLASAAPVSVVERFAVTLNGDPPAAPAIGNGTAVAMVDRQSGAMSIVELPDTAFCTRLIRVEDDGDAVRVDAIELMGIGDQVTRAQLADASVAKTTAPRSTLSSFRVGDCAERIAGGDAENDISVHTVSSCGRFATVVDHSQTRSGVALLNSGKLTQVAWAGNVTVSGVVAKGDGKLVSALVSGEGGAKLQFWDTQNMSAHCQVPLPEERFGAISHSSGAVWNAVRAPFPEGGKVVKSAYEIFDDRNWNDIDSSFSSLGLNQ